MEQQSAEKLVSTAPGIKSSFYWDQAIQSPKLSSQMADKDVKPVTWYRIQALDLEVIKNLHIEIDNRRRESVHQMEAGLQRTKKYGTEFPQFVLQCILNE